MFVNSNKLMLETSKTYRLFAIVLLTMFFAIPCTLKRDVKQFLGITTHQSSSQSTSKIGCVSVCKVQQISQNKQEVKKTKSIILVNFQKDIIPQKGIVKKPLNAYLLLKEKIPTQILYQQFLI